MRGMRDEQLKFLKPVWKAANWNYSELERKPDHVLTAIYLQYKGNPKKVKEILDKAKQKMDPEVVQLSFFDQIV